MFSSIFREKRIFFTKYSWEFFLVFAFIVLSFGWKEVRDLLTEYEISLPFYYYLSAELLWDITAAMTVWKFLGLRSIKKNQKIDIQELLLSTQSISKEASLWFGINRIVAIVQPAVTFILVLRSSLPLGILVLILTFLLLDLVHTFFVIKRFKVWQKVFS